MMFDTVRVGDKIWTVQLGDAKIVVLGDKNFKAQGRDSAEWYYYNGRCNPFDAAPSAFWSRPVFEEPPPPKRMKKVRIERRMHIEPWPQSKDGFACVTGPVDNDICPTNSCIEHFDI